MKRLLCSIIIGALALLAIPGVFAQDQVIHTVQPGQTLYRIGLQYNVPFTSIAQANNLANPNLIFSGQQLIIPNATGGSTGGDTGGSTGGDTGGNTGGDTGGDTGTTTSYTVARGDTLGRIAARFGTTVSAIAQSNGIANPNLIFVGQVLNIGGSAGGNTGGSTGTPPTTGNPGTAPITGFNLGGHVFGFSYPDLMRQTGMTWAKIQGRYSQGDSPDTMRDEIDAAKSRGFKVLLSVVGDPGQVAANPTQYYQDYAGFLGGVAALGADGIEVWNEPNIQREWPAGLINGGQYTQMLSAAYQSIKRSNPNTLVVSAAPAPTGSFGGCAAAGCDDNTFIAQMAAAGAANSMDCVGIHYNAGAVPPSATSGAPVGSAGHYSWYYPTMVSLYRSTFPSKPLCFTEIGYLSGEGYGPLPGAFGWAAGNTVAEQAQWLADAVRLARNSGVVRLFIIWNVDNQVYNEDPQAGYAIVRPDGSCPACNTVAAALR